MQVLHLCASRVFGGVETYLLTLARHRQLASGLDCSFALCFEGRFRDELNSAGAPVHDLGWVRFSRPWTLLRARLRLRRVLRAGRFDAVLTHTCWPHAAFAPVVRQAGVPLVHMVHDALGSQHWTERWAARTPPDLVIANSRFSAGAAQTVFPQSPMAVCAYALSAPPVASDREAVRHAVRTELGTPADAVVILQASRLEAWKGHTAHLKALARLRHVHGWEAWIAGGAQQQGEEEYLANLRSFAAEAGIADRVRFLGQRSDVPRLMAATDVYCQPNVGPEPFGVVFVEALYAGVPVVTSAMGGALEIVTDACGVLVPPNHPEAVAAALAQLITVPDLRARLGQAGPARAQEVCGPEKQLNVLLTTLLRTAWEKIPLLLS